MGPETLDNDPSSARPGRAMADEPDEIAPQDQEEKKKELYNNRLSARQSIARPGLRVSDESEDKTDEQIGSPIASFADSQESEDVKGKQDEYKIKNRMRRMSQSMEQAKKRVLKTEKKAKKTGKWAKRIRFIIKFWPIILVVLKVLALVLLFVVFVIIIALILNYLEQQGLLSVIPSSKYVLLTKHI